MNKKGAILIFTLMVVMVLGILLIGFFTAVISENRLVRDYVDGIRAFWLAEAGIARAIDYLPNKLNTTEYIGNYNYTVKVDELSPLIISGNNTTVTYYFYNITSTGYAGSNSRKLNTVVRRKTELNATSNSFPYSLESTVNIDVRGSVDITGDNGCQNCTGGGCGCIEPQCCRENSTLNFPALFGVSKEYLESYAESIGKKYTPGNLPSEISGLNWVEGNLTIASSNNLRTAENQTAILIVEGNARFSGNINFDGIIYIIGELTITGTVDINGAVLAESKAETETDVRGNVLLNRNGTIIQTALNTAIPANETERTVICWREF
jgi:hypothetical protein